jgi:hypothetical protein
MQKTAMSHPAPVPYSPGLPYTFHIYLLYQVQEQLKFRDKPNVLEDTLYLPFQSHIKFFVQTIYKTIY